MLDMEQSMHEACRTCEARSPAGAVRNAAKAADDVPSSVGIQKTSVVLDSLDLSSNPQVFWFLSMIGSPSIKGISRSKTESQTGRSIWMVTVSSLWEAWATASFWVKYFWCSVATHMLDKENEPENDGLLECGTWIPNGFPDWTMALICNAHHLKIPWCFPCVNLSSAPSRGLKLDFSLGVFA